MTHPAPDPAPDPAPNLGRDLGPQIALPQGHGLPLPVAAALALALGMGVLLSWQGDRPKPAPAASPVAPTPQLEPVPALTLPQEWSANANGLAYPAGPTASFQPTPVQPALAQPTPVQPAPAQPTSAQPSSIMPTPILPTRSFPAPTYPAPAQPSAFFNPSLIAGVPRTGPRSREGALVIDLSLGSSSNAVLGQTPPRNGDGAGLASQSGDDVLRATLIRNRANLVPQGTILPAVLETPLQSDRPGLARALVAQDVRGFDGTRILIPRGSRLIGEFRAENAPGKRRILVLWNRMIRPDGVAIRLASPAADALGGIGVAGAVSTHFAEKLASAVLQSALTIGVNVASAELGRAGGVYVGLPGQMSGLGQQLVPSANRPASIAVREGAQIAVLVARDLDFSGTSAPSGTAP